MDIATTVIVFIMIVAGLAAIIRAVSKAIRKAKRAQIKYENENPPHYL